MNYDISFSAFRDIKYYLTNLSMRKVALYNCKYSMNIKHEGTFLYFLTVLRTFTKPLPFCKLKLKHKLWQV